MKNNKAKLLKKVKLKKKALEKKIKKTSKPPKLGLISKTRNLWNPEPDSIKKLNSQPN